MGSFPAGATIYSGVVRAVRSIGGVSLNDGINVWCDPPEYPYSRTALYERPVNRNGSVVRVRRDRNAAEIILHGVWKDEGGRRWPDFLAQMEAVDKGALLLGDGTAYAEVDILDCAGEFVGIRDQLDANGRPQQVWRWTMKCQPMSPDRVAV